jgi:hypothetical protein
MKQCKTTQMMTPNLLHRRLSLRLSCLHAGTILLANASASADVFEWMPPCHGGKVQGIRQVSRRSRSGFLCLAKSHHEHEMEHFRVSVPD